MYVKKIHFDFTILQSVFTIRVYFIFFMSCQKCIFDNLDDNHTKPVTSYLIKKFIFSFCFVLSDILFIFIFYDKIPKIQDDYE
jgi:hypothetical protein